MNANIVILKSNTTNLAKIKGVKMFEVWIQTSFLKVIYDCAWWGRGKKFFKGVNVIDWSFDIRKDVQDKNSRYIMINIR